MKLFLMFWLFFFVQMFAYDLPVLKFGGSIVVVIKGDLRTSDANKLESKISMALLEQKFVLLDRNISPVLQEINFQESLSLKQKEQLSFLGADYVMVVEAWRKSNTPLADVKLKVTDIKSGIIKFLDFGPEEISLEPVKKVNSIPVDWGKITLNLKNEVALFLISHHNDTKIKEDKIIIVSDPELELRMIIQYSIGVGLNYFTPDKDWEITTHFSRTTFNISGYSKNKRVDDENLSGYNLGIGANSISFLKNSSDNGYLFLGGTFGYELLKDNKFSKIQVHTGLGSDYFELTFGGSMPMIEDTNMYSVFLNVSFVILK